MSRLQVSLLEGEAFGSSIDGTFMASLDEPPVGRPVGRVHRHWRTLLGVLYLLGMGMCSVVLCALGATLQELAANCGRSSLALSSVYVARGAGSILGAMACAASFKRLHGNHVIAGTLAALSSVLLVLPYTTDATALHVLFALLGSMTATIDTGVQIMTRKAHGARAGPWLGGNTLAFGLAGSLVPLVSLLAGNRVVVVYVVFAAYALVVATGLLAVAVPAFMGEPEAAHAQPALEVSRGVGSYGVERLVAVAVFLVIGGQVAMTSYAATYVDEVWGGGETDGVAALALLWVAITLGRVAGLARQVALSRRCDRLDAAAAAAGVNGPSAHGAPAAVAAAFFDLRGFLGAACLGGALMVGGGRSRGLWLAGLAVYGAGNGPALGMLYDLAHRTTRHSEGGTAVIMVGLNLGASLLPWAAAQLWSLARAPAALSAVALASVLLPLPLLHALRFQPRGAPPSDAGFSPLREDVEPLGLELGPVVSEKPSPLASTKDSSSSSSRPSGRGADGTPRHQWCWRASAALLVAAAVGMAVSIAKLPKAHKSSAAGSDDAGGVTSVDDGMGDDFADLADDAAADEAPLGLAAEYDYISLLGPVGADYPWVKDSGHVVVVDVGKPLTLVATGLRAGCEATWVVDSGRAHHASPPNTWMGVFAAVGAYPASVSEQCPGDAFGRGRSTSGMVVATWVRRELRELTPSDLAAVMDAMAVCYNTSTAAGKLKYGDSFVGLDTFQLWHHLNSAQRDADHFHQGVGFLAQHAKVTRLFEMSLQAVNPTLALPFWDASVETAQVASGALTSVWGSPLWSPAMFGTVRRFMGDAFNSSDPEATTKALFGGAAAADGTLDDATMRQWAIQDGRFAFLQLPQRDASTLPAGTPTNAYGLLRAPWNSNPSPYVTRYPTYATQDGELWNKFPTCSELRVFALDAKASVGGWAATAWMYAVSNQPHGTMHSGPGGTATLRANRAMADLVGPSLASGLRQHTVWRFRRLDFPAACAAGVPPAACQATCNRDLWDLADLGYELLKSQTVLPSDEQLAAWRADPAFMAQVGETYCGDVEVIISGDAKDSGGCVEPSFWPIHGALERLYQYRILKGPGFRTDPSTEWPVKHTCFGARSNNFDPDRLCYLGAAHDDPLSGRPTPGDDAGCCGGHHADGRVFAAYPDGVAGGAAAAGRRSLQHHDDDGPFESDDAFGPEGSVGPTNQEMLKMLNPLVGPNFNYPVYHHFRWAHCDALGENFP